MESPAEEKGMCGVHKNKPLISFCLNHHQPCCDSCIQNFHSQCENIHPLDDFVTEEITYDISDLIGQLDRTSSQMEEVITERLSNLDDLDSQQKELEASISKLREVINSHFDDLEYKLHQDVYLAHKKCCAKIQEEIKNIEKRKETLHKYKNKLNMHNKKAADLTEVKQIAESRKANEEYLKHFLGNLYSFDYELKFKTEILNIKSTSKSLGVVEIQTYPKHIKLTTDLDPERKSEKQLKDCTAKEIKNFSLSPEVSDPFITGGAYLPEGKLLLTDMGNSKLYIVDENGSFEDEIGIHGDPFDVAMVNGSIAALTIPKQYLIQYVNVKNKTIGKQFRLKERPWGITFNGKHIFTICDTSIVALDTRGGFVKKIDVAGDVEYIAASENYIYYTAGNMPVVHCVGMEGEEIFKNVYKNLNRPAGISLDRQGHVYVVGSKSRNVHQLEPTGKLIKIIVPTRDDVSKIRAIGFSSVEDRFFITHDDAKVKLYELSYSP